MFKVTHYGEDYAIVKVGRNEFQCSIGLAKALERNAKREKAKIKALTEYAEYVNEYPNWHGSDCYPVCFDEWLDNEYKEN